MAAKARKKPSTGTRKNAENNKKKRITIISISVGFIGLIVILYLNIRGPLPIRDIALFPGQQRGHVADISYPGELPPVGGEHLDIWQNCGVYTEPINTGNAVHSLEHGAVWITYHPDLAVEQITELQDLVRNEDFILLSPYPELRSPVVVTAWQVQLQVDSAGDGRIQEFIEQYRQGPYTPERGASCTNGVGEPIG